MIALGRCGVVATWQHDDNFGRILAAYGWGLRRRLHRLGHVRRRLADTSGILAAYDETDPLYDKARYVLNRAGTIVMSPLVLAELDHVGYNIGFTHDEVLAMFDGIAAQMERGRLIVPELKARFWRRLRRSAATTPIASSTCRTPPR
ncbi:hypothetical protein ACF1HA_38765 [Streptomyces gardneri]|uniref:Uncharacterized protein n=1 Tax=Streptomyces gardneri TaxID=66892 RepID=A0A4Y3RRY6_9ACTN|nr:hypothetical protein [Streptomyces gardneri]GEB60109.1 hypothetical protein SGA01_57140 [Streptomyces gardneri]GHH21302.1 hypothetical protein GCM10017674_75920 [Streptomyces gardneri]